MKIGYPCINTSLPTSSKTFRLASFSEEKLIETVAANLDALQTILQFNSEHTLLFFRISSDLIPFASHPVNTYMWQERFAPMFKELGKSIEQSSMRISMNPDQFVLLNSPSTDIFTRSVAELEYHCQVLELLHLDNSHKIQIHVGGVYGDKKESMKRFIERFNQIPQEIQKRLVIENDDRLYSLVDCLSIHHETGIPILFDNLHHECLNTGESLNNAFKSFTTTWHTSDGIPMVDYSEQAEGARIGKHRESLEVSRFTEYLNETSEYDFDIMLEIKDKEKSAMRAIAIMQQLQLDEVTPVGNRVLE